MKKHWVCANRIVREVKPALSRIERHSHEVFHFVYCMDGVSIVYVDGQFFELKKDDALLISPHVEHAFYMKESFLTIEAKFHRDIIDEALKQNQYYEDVINAKLLFLMLSIMRKSTAAESTLSSDYRYSQLTYNGKDAWLSSVIRYIEDSISQPITVKSVATHFGYESGYFSHIFREKFSYPLSRYIAERKIEVAKEMLMDGRSVTDVSQELSFSSVHHFSKKFKAMVGISPAKFNERIRVQLAVNVSGDRRFPPTGEFEYHTLPWDGKSYN